MEPLKNKPSQQDLLKNTELPKIYIRTWKLFGNGI